jgi:hypothetical protein
MKPPEPHERRAYGRPRTPGEYEYRLVYARRVLLHTVQPAHILAVLPVQARGYDSTVRTLVQPLTYTLCGARPAAGFEPGDVPGQSSCARCKREYARLFRERP